ncbi:MAG: AAC(3) family N-acetyltransferase [Ignavibacteriales bacterium]
MDIDIRTWIIEWFKEQTGETDNEIRSRTNENYFENCWMDSFTFISFITKVEEKFNISFDNDEFQDRSFATIEGLIKNIESKLKQNQGNYSESDIIDALKNIGVEKGDNIFVHSNIGFFGKLKGAKDEKDYYKAFKEAIFEVIGDEGSLIVPTFSYSYCWGKIFDKENTPGICGFLSEMARKDANAIRSEDGNFSVAAIGKNAEYFTKDAPDYSFGKGTFWEKFFEMNGKFCNFNFDAASTFIHYIERELKVPYRYDKPFHGKSIINGKEVERVFYHFVYDTDKPDTGPEFSRFDRRAKSKGLAKAANLGKGQIVTITAQDSMQLIKEEIDKNPGFLTRGSNSI